MSAQVHDIARAQILASEQKVDIIPAWKKRELFTDENGNDFPDRFEKEVKGEEIILHEYATVLNHSKSIWSRLRAFFGASTAAGRGAKAIKDFILLFVPYGNKIDSVTEFVTERFIKPESNTNAMVKVKDPATTTMGIAMILVGIYMGITSLFGIGGADFDPTSTAVMIANFIGGLGLFKARDAKNRKGVTESDRQ